MGKKKVFPRKEFSVIKHVSLIECFLSLHTELQPSEINSQSSYLLLLFQIHSFPYGMYIKKYSTLEPDLKVKPKR